MARPVKQTVDYFPHDSDASDGRTISILENTFGLEGYALWFKLLERLSRSNNHVIGCRNCEDTEYLAAKMKISSARLIQFLDKLAEVEAIDKELWGQRVVWCENLVRRLADVYRNRGKPLPEKPAPSTPVSPTPTEQPKSAAPPEKTKKDKSFEAYKEELRKRFSDLDFDGEMEKFNLWHEKKPAKNTKLALLNWMNKARDFKAKGGKYGAVGRSTERDRYKDWPASD